MVGEINPTIVNTLQLHFLVLSHQIKRWKYKLPQISISLNFKSKDYEIDSLLPNSTKKKTYYYYS
jgi:hypothetical protein